MFDEQMRVALPDPLVEGEFVDWDGPLRRLHEPDGSCWVEYVSVAALDDSELDALITRQLGWSRGRLEWKYYSHDLPPDLPQRLIAAGFAPEESETVVVAVAADVTDAGESPAGVTTRRTTSRTDLDGIDALNAAVWGPGGGQADALERELRDAPDSIAVFVAEAAGTIVSAGWMRMWGGVSFAMLFGGSTLPGWRGRGIYRTLVAARARLAVERGFPYLAVDASEDSRPILERLGFVAITTTTPYVAPPRQALRQPPGARAAPSARRTTPSEAPT
jgi:GNAT superfamily N-acetyltransferase